MHVHAVSATFSHPLPQMLFSFSVFYLPCPDLPGFGLHLMRKAYPLPFLGRDSQIASPTDLGFCKDLCAFVADLQHRKGSPLIGKAVESG
ncbi:hypothetical protein ACSQ67_019747 [Phaseolus vulgaris]